MRSPRSAAAGEPRRLPAPADPSPLAAEAAPLRYVNDQSPGIRRRRVRGKFVYLDPHGRRLRDPDEIRRVERLAIPPAYRDVWICPDPAGHLQATGRDARGRKQYRYHPDWIAARGLHKYDRMLAFGHALPRIRATVDTHLAMPGLPAEKVMAAVVALLDRTLIRIGNPQYVRDNDSFGLTTLQDRHVAIRGCAVRFRFRGKSGVEHRLGLEHPRLARIVRRCQALPGQQLFQYVDDARQVRPVTSSDVNAYLKRWGGSDFSAKDYRTWAGSVLALAQLRAPSPEGASPVRRVAEAVGAVARQLGNTAAVCRKGYIHPDIVDAFLAGELATLPRPRSRAGLSAAEAALLAFLQQRRVHRRAPV